jgi:hypothetical protein
MDGFPVYGPRGPQGILMAPCGSSSADPLFCLDRCNGYYGLLSADDGFMYRYYMAVSTFSSLFNVSPWFAYFYVLLAPFY